MSRVHMLFDPEYVYEWTFDQVSLKSGTLVNCGLRVMEIFNDDPS